MHATAEMWKLFKGYFFPFTCFSIYFESRLMDYHVSAFICLLHSVFLSFKLFHHHVWNDHTGYRCSPRLIHLNLWRKSYRNEWKIYISIYSHFNIKIIIIACLKNFINGNGLFRHIKQFDMCNPSTFHSQCIDFHWTLNMNTDKPRNR